MLSQETKEFIAVHRNEDPRTLALQARRYPGVNIREAAVQIEGWQHAREKLPAWAATDGIIYPPRISMEQCSSEATALYKAALVKGGSIADLTGGFGIDCSYMARSFNKAYYIERSGLLCDIAKWNFGQLGLEHIGIINGNSEDILPTLPALDWIFIDPARRDKAGNKVVSLSDCEPDVCQLESLLLQKAAHVMVKCSPMLDISQAIRELHSVVEVHVVSVSNECKELLLILGREEKENIPIRPVNFHGDAAQEFAYSTAEEAGASCHYASAMGRYLYEPNSSLMKAGCYRLPAQRFGLNKLHPNTHLYTSDTLVSDFPGRIFQVERVCGFSKKELKILDCKKANLAVRNFPERVDALQKRLKIGDGGSTYLFATTLNDESKVLVVCTKAHL